MTFVSQEEHRGLAVVGDERPRDPRARIQAFLKGFSVETTPGSAAKIPDYREILEPGTRVAVTWLPGADFTETLATAKRLRNEGFHPAPHITARAVASRAALDDVLARLTGEAGIEEVVVLAGGLRQPVGEFDNSMQLLETRLFDRYGVKRIGVAGHPEGSPDIPDAAAAQALSWKNTLAERSDASFYICTQFVFAAEPVIAWDRAIRTAGVTLPIRIGIPGLATLKTLVKHAQACGVGPSLRVLTRQAKNLGKLMTVRAPDRLVSDLARYWAEDPDCGIVSAHFYPLGGLAKTARWAYAARDGAFETAADERSFTVSEKPG